MSLYCTGFYLYLLYPLVACFVCPCFHLNYIWTGPRTTETVLSRKMTTSTIPNAIMVMRSAYAILHTDPERDYFKQRDHDVMS